MKYKNDEGISGVIAGFMIFVIVIVGAISFLMLTDSFNKQYDDASSDPVNNTGIYLKNSTPYESTKIITTSITDNIPVGIFLAFLLAVLTVIMLIWAILKRGD
jgi:hypothetical protein